MGSAEDAPVEAERIGSFQRWLYWPRWLGSSGSSSAVNVNATSATTTMFTDYAHHSVSGMCDGSPYIFAPGSSNDHRVCGLGTWLSHPQRAPALALLQAFLMPVVSLIDAGPPVAWRERLMRWCSSGSASSAKATANGFRPLQDLEA